MKMLRILYLPDKEREYLTFLTFYASALHPSRPITMRKVESV